MVEVVVTGFATYAAVAFVVGFLWMLLDARLEQGSVRESDVNEALFFSLFAFLWLPVRTVVTLLRTGRSLLLWVFNDLF